MTSHWPITTLREAGVSLLDCEHRTPPAAPDGFPYIAIPQLKDGRLDLREVRRISATHLREWTRKAKPSVDDVVLSRRCNPGETAVIPSGLECALGQNLVLLRADGARVYPPFLRWWVRGPAWWEQVGRFLNTGAVFDSLKCADVPEFALPLPPVGEQRAIARILGALDDKIELNRRMNETLEELARTIFKSWFVDFDPVRAKAEGRQPVGMDSETAALFPSRLVESELGEIPEAWRATSWDEIAGLEYGRALRGDRSKGNIPVYGTNGPIGFTDTALCPHAGVIVGRKGAYRGIHYCSRPFFVIDTAFFLESAQPMSWRWAYYELLRLDLNAMDSGSAIPSTSRDEFNKVRVCLPPPAVHSAFDTSLEHVWLRIEAARAESNTLAELRDLLLPKLISGELRIPLAEKLVEAAL